MPRYEVRTLDVWGNAVEGYEINNVFRHGDVGVRVDATDEQLIRALVADGSLSKNAIEAYANDELHVDDQWEVIEISEDDPEWAAVTDDNHEDARWLDVHTQAEAEAALEEGERAEQVIGHRPVLHLFLQEGRDEAVPFLNQRIEVGTRTAKNPEPMFAQLELRIDPDHLATETRRGAGVQMQIDVYIDGDFFGTFDMEDLEHVDLAVARNGAPVVGSDELAGLAKVALDAFLERTEISPDFDSDTPPELPLYVAQERGPFTGEAYVLDTKPLRTEDGRPFTSWTDAKPHQWRQAIVKHNGFPTEDEIGYVVIDGREMPVFVYKGEVLPGVETALTQRGFPVRPCGLNADWSVRAWFLGQGRPNMDDGGFYLLDTEQDGADGPVFEVVQRFHEELDTPNGYIPNPSYNDETQGIEEVTGPGTAAAVLDRFIAMRDAGEL